MTVSGDQRFRRGVSCPICGGSEEDDRGSGTRCYGFFSDDGKYAHCTREEFAGGLPLNPKSETYAHRLKGPCKCGREHGPADPRPTNPRPSKPNRSTKPKRKIVATYDYVDEAGELLYQALRYSDKSFGYRQPDGTYSLHGVRRIPYRLDELVASDPSTPVFVVEGEKDVDNLAANGLLATCNPMGAKKWQDEYSPFLAGRIVYIIGDNDKDGRAHVQLVSRKLAGIAREIRVLDLPETCRQLGLGELPEKGDVSDFFEMGGTAEQLLTALARTPPTAPTKTATPQQDETPTDSELGLTDLSTVTPSEVQWLWQDRIPLGKITLVAGEGGIGKTYLSLDLAARISRGTAWPDRPEEPLSPGDVIIVTAEDDLNDTIVPRLIKQGADLTRIAALGTARMPNGILSPFTLADIDRLEKVMDQRPTTRLIIVDPVTAFLGPNIDDHKNAELRALLGPLAEFAARRRVAILCITHFNKGQSAKAAGRVIGSVAYSNAARATWCVVMDPEQDGRRLMLAVKNNLSPDKTGMAYSLVDGVVEWEPEPINVRVNEVLAGESQAKAVRKERVIEVIRKVLADGPLTSEEAKARIAMEGIGKNSAWKYKDEAGVIAFKDGFRSGWMWKLADYLPPSS